MLSDGSEEVVFLRAVKIERYLRKCLLISLGDPNLIGHGFRQLPVWLRSSEQRPQR